jgi:hypothetical protein
MKRIYFVSAVTLMFSALIFASGQSPQPTRQSPQTAIQAQPTQSAKAKKVLVRELPTNLQGIELKDGAFRLSPGFKLVPKTASTVALVQNEAPGSGSATIDCSCSGNIGTTGACVPKTVIAGGSSYVNCGSPKENKCTGECIMVVTMGGSKTKLAIF